MRISKFSLVGAAVLLGSCVAVGALAQAPAAGGQQPGGGRQGRGGFGQGRFGGQQMTLSTVPMDVLVKELKLTDEQKTALAAIRTKAQADLAALRPTDGTQPNFQELFPKMQEVNQKAAKDSEAVLKDDQKADATALLKTLTVVQGLRLPIGAYCDLKLTAEQKTKLAALAAESAKDRAAKMQEVQAARDANDQAKVQELMTAMRGSFGGAVDEKTLAVLTAEQKDVVTKYVKEHPPRNRRPGGGAPGAPPAV